MIRLGLILISLAAAAGCSQSPQLASWRWSKASHAEDLSRAPESVRQLIPQARSGGLKVNSSGDRVVRIPQSIEGAPIEGTWLQVILSNQGEVQYLSATTVPQVEDKWAKEIRELRESQVHLLALWKENTGGRWSNHPVEAQVVVAKHHSGWEPAFKVTVVEEAEGQLREYLLDRRGIIFAEKTTSMAGIDGVATVFNGLPNRSNLEEEILPALVGDGTLTSQAVKAFSADGTSPFRPANDFRYTPDQREFDDVQAYYFADQQARWFQSNLDLTLPNRLEIKLHVGAPVPGNAAFYFRGQVRLGDGDGKTYRGIPRDPTIVKHEVSHAYVELLSGLPFEGEGGSYSEAFSDLFTALADDRPQMGAYAYVPAPFKRSIDNQLKFENLGKGKYENSLIISGTFWEISKTIGPEDTAVLAKSFLARLGPGGKFADFVPVIGDAARAELNGELQRKVMGVVLSRGWIREEEVK